MSSIVRSRLLMNLPKMCAKSGLVSISGQFVSFNSNNNNLMENYKMSPIMPLMVDLRHYSEGKAKTGKKEAQKLSYVEDEPRLTHIERLKRIIQNYGATAVIVHILVSLSSLGSWYSLLYFGIDLPSFINLAEFGETAAKIAKGSGTFAVAYALHKMCLPIRVFLTLIITPAAANRLRKLGIIKKPHKHL